MGKILKKDLLNQITTLDSRLAVLFKAQQRTEMMLNTINNGVSALIDLLTDNKIITREDIEYREDVRMKIVAVIGGVKRLNNDSESFDMQQVADVIKTIAEKVKLTSSEYQLYDDVLAKIVPNIDITELNALIELPEKYEELPTEGSDKETPE